MKLDRFRIYVVRDEEVVDLSSLVALELDDLAQLVVLHNIPVACEFLQGVVSFGPKRIRSRF